MSVPGWRSYVWDLDVEGMTGLWWREGGREAERRGEDGKLLQLMIYNWVIWWCSQTGGALDFNSVNALGGAGNKGLWGFISNPSCFYFSFFPLKERFLLESLLSFTFGLWEEEAFCRIIIIKKTGSGYDNTIKFGAMNHFRVDHQEWPLPRYHLIKISN